MTRAAHALAGILLGLVVAALLGRGCEIAADAVAPGDVVRADVDGAMIGTAVRRTPAAHARPALGRDRRAESTM